jgi:CheY-like chemotaxis protein
LLNYNFLHPITQLRLRFASSFLGKPSHRMSDQDKDSKDDRQGVAEGPPSARRKRVLLVEDEPLTRLIILNKLRLAGFDVDVAWNGCLALEKLSSGHPDAIFLDLMLPDIKGVEVIKEARQDPVFANRPIFVCTAAARMSVWSRRATDAGATKVFNKASTPVDQIVAEVAAALTEIPSIPGPAAAPTTEADSAIFERIPPKVQENVVALCAQAQQLAQCTDHPARTVKCGELRTRVQTVVSSAAEAGLHRMARVAAALEAFLKELCEKAKKVTDSSLHTISTALEVLGLLCHSPNVETEAEASELAAVVVEEDLVSRTAIGNALRNAGFKPTTFGNPAQALEHFRSHPADLVVSTRVCWMQAAPILARRSVNCPTTRTRRCCRWPVPAISSAWRANHLPTRRN